jgi:hypothetical protein
MPQIGFKCPGGVNPNGGSIFEQTFDSNYCIDACEHQCVPASVLVHIQSKLQRDKHKGWYISVTSLLGCLRQLYLERSVDYFVEPPKNWYMLRGAILHHLLENPGIESMIEDLVKEVWRRVEAHPTNQTHVNVILQEALEALNKLAALLPRKEIPNWESETEYEFDTGLRVNHDGAIFTISELEEVVYAGELKPLMLRGTIDVLRPETGEIYDYKTIGDRGLSVIKDGAKKDHIMQFNLYRLLVERGNPVGKSDYKPIEIKKITAFYMTMMQVVRTGGLMIENTPWRISDPTPHPNLTATLITEKIEPKLKRGKSKLSVDPDDYNLINNKRFKLTYAIPDVPLLDLDECTKFVQTNVPILYNGFVNKQMPPMCDPKDRLWRCDNYCPDAVRNACDAHNLITGEVREVPVAETDKEILVEEA